MKSPIFQVKELVKGYGGERIVDGLNFEVYPGEIVGLLGPNGAGKTTAFYMAVGLIRPDGGSVLFLGEDVTHLPMYKRARMGMGYLAQEPSVFRHLTVEENILAILETMPIAKRARAERIEELLHELHLEKLRKKRAATLSGGERRRLEITRALVTEPKFLMLDEPFANIDPIAISDLQQLIQLLAHKKGIGILITDHNAREIFSVVDRSYLMSGGRALLSGTVQELVESEEARQIYLGHQFQM